MELNVGAAVPSGDPEGLITGEDRRTGVSGHARIDVNLKAVSSSFVHD